MRKPSSLGGLLASFGLQATTVFRPIQATIEEVDGCEHASDCVDHYWRMIWFIIGVSCFIYFVLLAWTCWISNRVRKKHCYLCEDQVSKYDWVNGSHRRACQNHRMHKEFLARLPTPYASIVCPDCSEALKMWPRNRGPLYFTCDGENCIYQGYELKNTGDTRFNCFLHDFNLCKSCVENSPQQDKSIQKKPSTTSVLAKIATSSAASDQAANNHPKPSTAYTATCEIPKRPKRKSEILRESQIFTDSLRRGTKTDLCSNSVDMPVISADSADDATADNSKSAETLTELKVETGDSIETLIDSVKPSQSKPASATESELCNNVQKEDEQSTDLEPPDDLPDNTDSKKKQGKWNRSRSYAHAVDT